MLKNSARKSVLSFSVILNLFATDQSIKKDGRVLRTLFPRLPRVSLVVGSVTVGMANAARLTKPSAGESPSIVVGAPSMRFGRCCKRKLPSFWPVITLNGVPLRTFQTPDVLHPPKAALTAEFDPDSRGSS